MKTLIIKTGALGDVLRTTTLLNIIKDHEIHWLTKENAIPLLENNPYIKKIITKESLKNQKYNLILSLDDEIELCKLASEIKTDKLIGAYFNGDRTYTEDSKSWFDMGVISKHGIDVANALKKSNRETFQQHLFKMLNKEFNQEPYILNIKKKRVPFSVVGIEKRAGEVWPMKQWDKYDELKTLLEKDNYKVTFLEQRPTLKEYIENINNKGLIITGDTLAMHIALALNKKVVSLFGPTPAEEIETYNRMIKIKAETDCYCCYRRDTKNKDNCIDSIPLNKVYKTVKEICYQNF